MEVALLIIFLLIALLSPPVLVVFIVLYVKRGKEIKRLKSYINSMKSGQEPSVAPKPQVQAVPVQKPVVPAPVQPKPQVAVAKPVQPKPTAQKSKGISSINITFGVGVLLLTVVGAFFITASWSSMTAPVRCGVLLFVATVVFALSFVAGKLLKLTQTGFSFFSLGTFLLPIIIFGIGGMGLFDSGFTIKDNPGLVGAVAFLCFGVAGFVGSRVYASNFHMGIAYFGLTWMTIFVTSQVFKTHVSAPFIAVSIIAIAALVAHKYKPSIKGIGVYSIVMTFVSLLSVFSMLDIDEYGAIVAIGLSTTAITLLYKFRWKVMSHFLPLMMLLTVLSGFVFVLRELDPEAIGVMVYFFIGAVITYILLEALKARTITSDIILWITLCLCAIIPDKTDSPAVVITSVLVMICASAIMVRGIVSKKETTSVRYIEAVFLSLSIPMIGLSFANDKVKLITFVSLALVASVICLFANYIPGIKRDGPVKFISFMTVAEAGHISLAFALYYYGEAMGVTLSIMLILSLIIGILNSQKFRREKNISYTKKNPVFIALGILLTLCVPLLIGNIIDVSNIKEEGTLFITICSGIYILTTVLSWIFVKRNNKRFRKYYAIFELILTIETGIMLLISLAIVNFWVALISSVIFMAILYVIGDTRTLIVPSIVILVSTIDYMSENNFTDVNKMLVCLAIAALFMVAGRLLSSRKLFSGNKIDWLSISSVMFIISSIHGSVKSSWSIFFIALAVYFANFLRKEKNGFDRFALSLTAISTGLAFAVEDLIDIPKIIHTEYLLVIMLLVVFILRTVIKPFGKAAMRYIWISFFALAIFVEATSAAITSEISDLLIVGVTAIGIFIYSFIRKEKAWFVIAMVSLCGIAIYLAATFGNTWTWLIYLFVAGLILITIAMVNEYGKRKAEKNGDTSKKRLFSEWTW